MTPLTDGRTLPGPGGAGGVTDAEPEAPGEIIHELLDERPFAHARGATHHDGTQGALLLLRGGAVHYHVEPTVIDARGCVVAGDAFASSGTWGFLTC